MSPPATVQGSDSPSATGNPPQADVERLVGLYRSGRLPEAVEHARRFTIHWPEHPFGWTVLAGSLRGVGELDEAVVAAARVVELSPRGPSAHLNLGVLLHDLGRLEAAEAACRTALEIKPDYAEAHSNLGTSLMAMDRLDEAAASYREALEITPGYAEAHSNLGSTLLALGRLDDAEAACRKAVEIKPDHAEAHYNLGSVLHELGRLVEAEASYREALEIRPDYAEAHYNLGSTAHDLGHLDEASASYRRALKIRPDYEEAHNNLGTTLYSQGRLEEAEASCRRALEIRPDFAEAHNNLGTALFDLRRLAAAEASYRTAVEIEPSYAEAHSNLGNAVKDLGRLEEAEACYRRALDIKPDYAMAHNNLGNVRKDQGSLDDALASYRTALAIEPDYAHAHSNLLLTEQYRVGVTAARLKELHAEWDQRHGKKLRGLWREHCNALDPDKRLHIGLVSPDLGRHPVGYFLVRLLESNPADEILFTCYSDGVEDQMTERLKAASHEWRATRGTPDEALADIIRGDQIDILFDLSGHTGNNRLLLFARKPAPIQVTWAGYVGTTGLAAMDYLLSDRHYTPDDADHDYHERPIRMPDAYVLYDPPPYAAAVGPLPAEQNGFITFGGFNNPTKINDHVMEVWAKLLEAVPESRLILRFRGIDSVSTRARLLPALTTLGLDPSRLVLEGGSPHPELLARYNDIDIALDTFPYSGGLTTCEALWMGVPVITAPGKTFASRHSASYLSTLGLTELIAGNTASYVESAVELANDIPRLAALRAGLRERMNVSPLCDGPRFARHFSSAMRKIWREWCRET